MSMLTVVILWKNFFFIYTGLLALLVAAACHMGAKWLNWYLSSICAVTSSVLVSLARLVFSFSRMTYDRHRLLPPPTIWCIFQFILFLVEVSPPNTGWLILLILFAVHFISITASLNNRSRLQRSWDDDMHALSFIIPTLGTTQGRQAFENAQNDISGMTSMTDPIVSLNTIDLYPSTSLPFYMLIPTTGDDYRGQ